MPPSKATTRRRKATRRDLSNLPRDTILFFAGLMGVMYETVFTEGDRVQLLLLFGAMMGLPAFLRADEARGAKDDAAGEEPAA